ncbi:MAG: hypothetical protein OEV64_04445 [Desulfobulbaceae bacterium]|nr:hypothetical protein [Desulfobulbaceae bacterium]
MLHSLIVSSGTIANRERGEKGENQLIGERFWKDVKTAEPFEYKEKKKTRLSRESLWRDGFVNGGGGGS